MTKPFDPMRGYPDVEQGTSSLQVVEVDGRCPDARTIQAYSQSTNPRSRCYADQTRLYSRKRLIRLPFCEEGIRRARGLKVTHIGGGDRRGGRR